MINAEIIMVGAFVFFARIIDVSLGTIRTISIVNGRTRIAFFLGFMEIIIWMSVISTVLSHISKNPILVIFYALGFATGNVVGILIENSLSIGFIVLRIISSMPENNLDDEIRKLGFGVTTFKGEGMNGPVVELFIVCKRKDLTSLVPLINRIEPDAFYVTERANVIGNKRPYIQNQ